MQIATQNSLVFSGIEFGAIRIPVLNILDKLTIKFHNAVITSRGLFREEHIQCVSRTPKEVAVKQWGFDDSGYISVFI